MRFVVADTGPPNYLVLTGDIELLPRLFGHVLIPRAVRDELSSQDAPELVRNWVASPPEWLEIRPDPDLVQSDGPLSRLGRGEWAVITLATAIAADLLLIDDQEAATIARRRGLAVTGTLGILDLAARRGMVDLSAAFNRLKDTTFYYRQGLLDRLLARHRKDEG